MGQRKIPHTVCARGKRVAIGLRNGQLITGKFNRRADNNRWVEVYVPSVIREKTELVRIPRSQIVSFAVLKGELDLKKLGRKK